MGLVGAALKMKRDLFISWNLSVKLQGLFLTHLNPWGPIKGDSRSGLFTSRCYRRWNMRPLFFFHSNGPKNERLDGKWTKQSAVNSMCDYNGFLNEKQNIHHWRKIIIAITAFNLSYKSYNKSVTFKSKRLFLWICLLFLNRLKFQIPLWKV